ncbi:alpha/beta fold hydrolase [Papillibacter cinnamivorans]|uniref:Pimeloyl-ACP methyl ester carboxylesterase n=1 Tax=Papillibacter cinnamivorans DSM 12816 TaxID=1122930 RepID=A0A1W1YWH3_9FIRM|nr:alpha/beta hydrolase [Papillibacter cinnamivorans]SMC40058.1 Pimeloyl-ACP methyl ester carboxylesterase [Papillibacter cinnamivorans DSM 12816]
MANFTFQGKNIYYETHGEGSPLLVLNGIMMNCLSWNPFVRPFSRQNRLILLDMLDQGRSDKMEGPYTQEIQADLIRALLDELKLEKINILGISYGGEVALHFAVKYPSCVDRLVLSNTTCYTSPWLRDIGEGWNRAASDGEAYYYTTIPVIYSPKFYLENNEWMENRKKLLIPIFSNKAFVSSMIRLTDSASTLDLRDRISEIQAETLVISSEFDFITPPPEQKFIVSRLRHVSYALMPDCGHASMYEKPMLFASLVLGFVNNCETLYTV